MKCEVSIVKLRKNGFYPRTYYEIIPISEYKLRDVTRTLKSIMYLLVDLDMEHVFFPKVQYERNVISDEVERKGTHELSKEGFYMLFSSDPLNNALGVEILKAQCAML